MSTSARFAACLAFLGTLLAALPAVEGNSGYYSDAHSGNDTAVNEDHHADRPYWSTNGCTAVPDSVRGLYYFEHACDHHDGCYGNHWQSRLGCDDKFRRNMHASCNHNWGRFNPARYLCREVKDQFYYAVRNLGGPAYVGWSISSLLE